MAAQAKPLRAVHLFSVADQTRQAIGAPMPPVDRPEAERSLATLPQQLGEVDFTAAWTQGQTMSLEEGLAGLNRPCLD